MTTVKGIQGTDNLIGIAASRVDSSAFAYTDWEKQYAAKSKTKLCGFGPRANYADRATAVCWSSSANFCG
jgi:hypothetical protein